MQNKSLKIIAFILCGSLLLGALTACGNSSTTTDKPTETATSAVPADTTATTTEPAPETVTITDGYGREVTVTKPIKTVASGISTVTELLISLGVEDRIVGIDLSSSIREFLFKDLLDLPLISTSEDSHYAMDFEKIIALEPDIFITGVVPQEGFDDIVATLEPEIPVIAVSYDTPEEFVASLTLLGELFDCQAAAAEYSAFFQGTLDMIIERVAGLPEDERPRVYYEWMQYFTFIKTSTVTKSR
jgi:iron complex transport system substrate-binding protein